MVPFDQYSPIIILGDHLCAYPLLHERRRPFSGHDASRIGKIFYHALGADRSYYSRWRRIDSGAITILEPVQGPLYQTAPVGGRWIFTGYISQLNMCRDP